MVLANGPGLDIGRKKSGTPGLAAQCGRLCPTNHSGSAFAPNELSLSLPLRVAPFVVRLTALTVLWVTTLSVQAAGSPPR